MADKILGFLGDLVKPAGGGDGLTYFDFNNLSRSSFPTPLLISLATVCKLTIYNEGFVGYASTDVILDGGMPEDSIIGVAICMGAKVSRLEGEEQRLETIAEYIEYWKSHNTGYEDFELPAPVSEDVFYNYSVSPEKKALFENGDNEEYIIFQNGMSWGTWLGSKYNNIGLYVNGQGNITDGDKLLNQKMKNTPNGYYTVGDSSLIDFSATYALK